MHKILWGLAVCVTACGSAGGGAGLTGLQSTSSGGDVSSGGAATESGGSSSGGVLGATETCSQGLTRTCVGPGACAGGQVCGTGLKWSLCDCGSGAGGSGSGGAQTGTGGRAASTGGATSWDGGAESGTIEYGVDGGTGVDMYVMLDRSASMADTLNNSLTWWSETRNGLASFVNDAATKGTGVGLQYFPLDGVAPASCTADYSTPAVEVATLPGNSTPLSDSFQAELTDGFTPMGPALSGAIRHMKSWGTAHPGRVPVVVLVTDGFPTECDPQDTTSLALLAKTAFTTDPVVRTFTVGLNQAGADNLNAIAKAGGTGSATIIKSGAVGYDLGQALVSFVAAAQR